MPAISGLPSPLQPEGVPVLDACGDAYVRIFRCLLSRARPPCTPCRGESIMFPGPPPALAAGLHPYEAGEAGVLHPLDLACTAALRAPPRRRARHTMPPLPLQMGQSSVLGMSISLVVSFTTSSRLSWRCRVRSPPRLDIPPPPRPAPIPKNAPSMSSKPPPAGSMSLKAHPGSQLP